MIIVCTSCQARYKFDESKLGDRPKAKTRCAKCGASIEIENPAVAAMTLPPGPLRPAPAPASEPPRRPVGDGTMTGRDLHRQGMLELPRDKRFSLAVIQG